MTTNTTADLAPGQRVAFPGTLNSFPFTGTVQSVEPWLLTAGPKAGRVAMEGRGKKAKPLHRVTIVDVVIDESRPPRQADILADRSVRLMSATLDKEWEIVG